MGICKQIYKCNNAVAKGELRYEKTHYNINSNFNYCYNINNLSLYIRLDYVKKSQTYRINWVNLGLMKDIANLIRLAILFQ